MVRFVVAATLILFTGVNTFFFSYKDQLLSKNTIVLMANEVEYELVVEVAETDQEKRRGLMFREGLDDGEGMLFVNQKPMIASFWMKNMKFPIDMLFIGSDLRIKQIIHNALPCPLEGDCPSYVSNESIQYILEVPAMYSETYNVQKGDQLILNLDL